MSKTRLQELYEKKIRPELGKALVLSNVMEIPRLEKVVLNVGLKEGIGDTKVTQKVADIIGHIAGQKPVLTQARKSIAGFKLREGMHIGVKVTLRRRMMYEFLDRLINLSLPMVRDFQGVSDTFDRRGNYNLGIRDWHIFPEVDYTVTDQSHGLNVTIHTTAKNDAAARALLKAFGMPFKVSQ
jgi:large subunit ribosomal protein L5